MAEPAPSVERDASYADLEALPEHQVGEILAGELHVSPRPAPTHAQAATHLAGLLRGFSFGDDGPGGWRIFIEPELHLGRDILVPDFAGWRRERQPRLPETPYFTTPPDWACELLSSSTARTDRVRKVPIYAREGVRHVWLLDPVARTLEVLRLDGEGYRLAATFGGDDAVRAEPFDAIELPLGLLWIE